MRLTNYIRRIYVSFLMVLFLGYYVSITLFYHTHIVQGDTIVHSHPYKTDNKGLPSHSHSEKGYIIIHFLSCFSVFIFLFFFNFKTITPIVYKIIFRTSRITGNSSCNLVYSLRAPPLDMLQ